MGLCNKHVDILFAVSVLLLHVQTKPRTPEAEHSQSFGLLLGEDADEEVGLVMRLESGGNQQVFPRRQREALRHFPHVDVGPAASLGRVVAEEILSLVVCVIWGLMKAERRQRRC